VTLMNYFADLLAGYKDKSVFQCLKEFTVVHDSARESTTEINKQVTQLAEDLNPIKVHLASGECDSTYAQELSTWAPTAEYMVNEIQNKNSEVQKGLVELLDLFGEPISTKSEDFFGLLSSFATNVEQSYLANEKRRAAARKFTRKNSKRLTGSLTESQRPTAIQQQNQGEFDRILNRMKNGQVFVEKRTQVKENDKLL